MTIPTTAAMSLFLWRVREASAIKSVLLWDVIMEGSKSSLEKKADLNESLSPTITQREREEREQQTQRHPEPSSACSVQRGAAVT